MFIKNNKGFSLIEVLVTMGLVSVLAAVAIPAYNNYRSNANETVLKSDASNAYKAYHAFNAVEGHFCATLSEAGLNSLTQSQTYVGDKTPNSYVGFGDVSDCTSSDPTHTLALSRYTKGSPPAVTSCVLESAKFVLGVSNTFGGDKKGYSVSNANNAPKAGNASCSVATCTDDGKAACESSGAGKHTCHGAGAGGGTWTPMASLCS